MTQFESVRRETLADSMYWQLREAIMSGQMPGGTELNQAALSRQFSVSRVPVREALRRLQAERFVTVTPYQQYVVSAVRPDTVLELIDIREQLETFSIRRHISTLSSEVLEELKERNARLRKELDRGAWLRGDWELHNLMDGPGTEAARLVGDLRDRVRRYISAAANSPTRQKQACVEHDRIIAAMGDGDADAAEAALRLHISHTRNIIVSRLIELNPDGPEGQAPTTPSAAAVTEADRQSGQPQP